MAAKIIQQGNEGTRRRKWPVAVAVIFLVVTVAVAAGLHLWRSGQLPFDFLKPEESISNERATELFKQSWGEYQKNKDVDELLTVWEKPLDRATGSNRDTLLEYRNAALTSAEANDRALQLLLAEEQTHKTATVYALLAQNYLTAGDTAKGLDYYKKALAQLESDTDSDDVKKDRRANYEAQVEAIDNPGEQTTPGVPGAYTE